MVALRKGLAVSVAALVAGLMLLVALGLGMLPALVGLACGGVLSAAVARGVARTGGDTLGPADVVTLTRATLACALAALVADPSLGQQGEALPVSLVVVALALDTVDGWVARATGTTSPFGARFDGEADAFLLVVLSVPVASWYGRWVLVIGAARYAFWLAGRVRPWLRRPLPFRYWRKVVTAVQGIALAAAVAGVLPRTAMYAALVVAVALLAESFGRDVLWSWRRRAVPGRSWDGFGAVRLPVP